MPKKLTSSKTASLFDIRLKNLDHDVLVLKGNAQDAASALLAGKIMLSLNEPLSIKKFTLRMYANLRLSWQDSYKTTKGEFTKPTKFSKKVYEYVWDNVEINLYLTNLYDNSSQATPSVGISRNQSASSLKNLGSSFLLRSSSNLQLTGMALSNSASSTNLSASPKPGNHILVAGNYEFPFSAVLPGDMPESVEGLPGASLVYRLEATIDRGKFHAPMVAKRHIRVIRTLTTDAAELTETVAVDNTWPKKVEYSLNVPCKAIAIGSGTPISFMLVPLLKGLRLGDISIKLVEYYSYFGYLPPAYNAERIVCEKSIPRPLENDPNFQMDKWEVDTFLRVPLSLSKCTQDCDIFSNLKVRHKIKFVIGLVNPDGHVSELRASLPILLFISPFVTIRASHDDPEEVASHPPNEHGVPPEEEELFTNDLHSASNTSLSDMAEAQAERGELRRSNNNSATNFNGFMAPPVYEKHIYDRLWSDVSPVESPVNSGASTPRVFERPASEVNLHFAMSPLDSVQLNENLRQLSLQRQVQDFSEPGSPIFSSLPGTPQENRAIFNLDGEADHSDYFSRSLGSGSYRPAMARTGSSYNQLISSSVGSPVHISRINSDVNLSTDTLSKVPSYNEALKGDAEEIVLAPMYEPPLPGSQINLAEVNKRFEEMRPSPVPQQTTFKNRSLLSRGSSSANLRNLSSGNSSPSNSRNVSSSNLAGLSRSSSKRSLVGSGSNSNGSSGVSLNAHLPKPSTSPIGISALHSGSAVFSMTPLPHPSTSPVHNSTFKTQDLPSHLMLHTQSTSSLKTKPSSSAADRSAAANGAPMKSASSLSLHNLQFLNRKKEKKEK